MTQFFFLPESVLPDSFYMTEQREASFEREEFKSFRIDMDTEGGWIDRVLEIIQEYPLPRQTVSRPIRWVDKIDVKEQEPIIQPGALKQSNLEIPFGTQPVKETLSTLVEATVSKNYTRIMVRKHRDFYRRIMDECCQR